MEDPATPLERYGRDKNRVKKRNILDGLPIVLLLGDRNRSCKGNSEEEEEETLGVHCSL